MFSEAVFSKATVFLMRSCFFCTSNQQPAKPLYAAASSRRSGRWKQSEPHVFYPRLPRLRARALTRARWARARRRGYIRWSWTCWQRGASGHPVTFAFVFPVEEMLIVFIKMTESCPVVWIIFAFVLLEGHVHLLLRLRILFTKLNAFTGQSPGLC